MLNGCHVLCSIWDFHYRSEHYLDILPRNLWDFERIWSVAASSLSRNSDPWSNSGLLWSQSNVGLHGTTQRNILQQLYNVGKLWNDTGQSIQRWASIILKWMLRVWNSSGVLQLFDPKVHNRDCSSWDLRQTWIVALTFYLCGHLARKSIWPNIQDSQTLFRWRLKAVCHLFLLGASVHFSSSNDSFVFSFQLWYSIILEEERRSSKTE